MAKLKPWYQVVTPREDLRENRPMDASEFAVHLDHIREKRQGVSQDYLNPARFFERTYLTGSLLELTSQVVRRLSGIQVETSAVFNMATQFGGGKTHSLTTLYHLAKTGESARKFKGVESILSKAEVPKIPKGDVAVFVGTEFDVLKGRGGDGEPLRKTPWGEIAWQLGGEKTFAAVAEHDAKGVAPAGDALRGMLPDGPAMILMDELLNYISRGRASGMRDQLFNFLQNLSEEARARNNFVLCVSIPASELEMNPEDQRDHDSFKKLLDRVGKAIMMSADTEMAEIIRRRLFDWDGPTEDGRKAAAAYADWAIEHTQELSGVDPDTAHELFRSSYPFHPSLLSVFERKWQSLPRFQKTRGVLRLLALWVAHAYQEEHRKVTRDPLITLGTAPFENPHFRSALFGQLGSDELEVPVTTDIAGKADAHAVRLDREATEDVKKERLHRKSAATIFFESNGGMTKKIDATLPEIRFSVGGPEVNLVHLDNVLEGLVGTCFYLNWDHNRYRFGLSPNLNQILVTRRGGVSAKDIDERIKKDTQDVFNAGPSVKEIDRKFFPERSNDVPNRPMLTLAVLALDRPAGRKETNQLGELIVRESGGSGRTYKSALIFAVPDAAETVRDAAREALAWEAIEDDHETKERLDDAQRQLLQRNLKRSKKDLKEAIFRTYRHFALLDKDNKLRTVDLGNITSSMANSLVDVYLNSLLASDDVTKTVGTSRLIKSWPPALTEWSTKAARDAFYSSPLLPRLLNPETIKRTIADGVAEGRLGYATKDGDRLVLERFNESLSESEVEISDEFFILKGEDAKKLLEPPQLAVLKLHPDSVTLKPAQQASFACTGEDQYGRPFEASNVEWTATGGNITSAGLFTAASDSPGGQFAVNARSGTVEAIADVKISKPTEGESGDDGDEEDGGDGSKGVIRWRGEIPPQKWMNFYMKVVSRFGNTPGLKLTVTLEVPAEGDQAKAKAQEAKSGLKELGLSDDVLLS